jgi:hypothetical protein
MTLLLVAVASFVAAAVNSIAGGGTFLTFPTLTRVAFLPEKEREHDEHDRPVARLGVEHLCSAP